MLAAWTLLSVGLLASATTGCSGQIAEPTPHPTSAKDAAEIIAGCLNGKGWKATVVGDSFGVDSVPTEQYNQYLADIASCEEGVLPSAESYTASQWAEWYGMWVKTAECLTAEGFEVEEMPSEQAFIDAAGNWNAYTYLFDSMQLSSQDFIALEQKCPQPSFWG